MELLSGLAPPPEHSYENSMFLCFCDNRNVDIPDEIKDFQTSNDLPIDKWEYLRLFPMVSDDINELGVFPVKFYYVLKKEL